MRKIISDKNMHVNGAKSTKQAFKIWRKNYQVFIVYYARRQHQTIKYTVKN